MINTSVHVHLGIGDPPSVVEHERNGTTWVDIAANGASIGVFGDSDTIARFAVQLLHAARRLPQGVPA